VSDARDTEARKIEAAAPAAAIELVVAVSENDVIGRDNGLPWHLPADLRHFKALTLGTTVLMGRKTHESIGRALPGRRNVILTRSPGYTAAGCELATSLPEARRVHAAQGTIMVIGGAEVYRECLPYAVRIHLTLVHTHIADGDARFDGWRDGAWREAARVTHAADPQNPIAYSFLTLERASPIADL
jgi:dihydrofolate reductase